MPAYSEEKKNQFMEYIRRLLVMSPNISILSIQESLEKSKGIRLDKDYIHKLRNKIFAERANRYNYYTIKKLLPEYSDEIEIIKSRLWSILNNKDAEDRDKIRALSEIRNSSKDLLNAMADAGVFTREIGKLDTGMAEIVKMIKEYYPKKEIKPEDVPGEAPQE